jgi:hypothetical protein
MTIPLALLLRRSVAESQRPVADDWEVRSRRPAARLTSSPVLGVAFAICLLAYILTGVVAVGVLDLLLGVGFLVAFALWGGVNTWVRSGRRTNVS